MLTLATIRVICLLLIGSVRSAYSTLFGQRTSDRKEEVPIDLMSICKYHYYYKVTVLCKYKFITSYPIHWKA